MKIVLQQSEQDCLLACYSMILGDMGLRVSPGICATGGLCHPMGSASVTFEG